MKAASDGQSVLKKDKQKNPIKLFFSGVMILTVTNLIVKVIGLMFKIPMNYIVGDEGMGYYNSAYTFYTYIYMLSTAGLPTAISIIIADSRAAGRIAQVRRILNVSLALFFFIGVSGMAAMFIFSGVMSDAICAPDTRFCIMAIAPTLFFICISGALRGYFQGYQQMLPVAVSQLTEAACKLCVGIVFALYAAKKGEPVYVIAAYAAIGLTIGAGLGMMFLLFSKLLFHASDYDMVYISGTTEPERNAVEKRKMILARLVKIALPITVSASVMSLTNLIDMAMVQRLLQHAGYTQSAATELYGNYTSLAVPMFNLPPVLIYPIACSIVPLITAARKRNDMKTCNTVAESSIRVAMLVGLPCSLGLASLAKPVLGLFYIESSVELAAPLLALLAPSSALVCTLAASNAVLQANGFEKCPLISMIFGSAVKIVSGYFLVHYFGMAGTPVSTFLCYLVATIINLYFVGSRIGVTLTLSALFLKPLICSTACSLCAYFMYGALSGMVGGRLAVLVSMLAAVLVYAALIIAIGGISENDLKLLPKSEKTIEKLQKLKLIKNKDKT